MNNTMVDVAKALGVEDYLDRVNYDIPADYVPSDFALEFVTFIKLVNGADGEENLTPLVHYYMLDTLSEGGRRIANLCHRGIAKALSLDTQILTPKGNVQLRNLQVGDHVFARTGEPTRITHMSEVFDKPMYAIHLADGRKLKVSEDHINIVQKRRTGLRTTPGFNEYNLTTKELIDKGVTYSRKVSDRCPTGKEVKWYIPTAEAIALIPVQVPIDPYTVGVILGDGSVSKDGFTRIHTQVDDLEHFLFQVQGAERSSVRADQRNPNAVRFSIHGLSTEVKDFIGTENVYRKRVPQCLLWGSIDQRLAVLQGLMDTDGTCYENGCSSFTSASPGLINDVTWLVRSLGGEVTLGTTGDAQRVQIKMDICPFRLERKVTRWKPTKVGRTGIVDIVPIEQQPSQCIRVADESHSFLAEEFFVTHNTTLMAEYLFLYIACYGCLPGFGKIDLALYVSDSIENGVKNMRKNLEFRWENSDFLKHFVPETRFTDIRWEFVNADGQRFIVKGYGAKALSLDSELHTLDGRLTIGECKVGDRIFGADGRLTTITAKSEVFNKPMYELLLEDGRTLKVSEDHYNPVMVNTNPNNTVRWEDKTLTTLELLEQPLVHTKKGNTKHRGTSSKALVKVRNIEPLEYPKRDLPIDPYTLGVVLGDGRIRKDCGSVELTVHQDELSHYHKEIPYEFGALYDDLRSNAVTQSIRGLGKILKSLDLNVRGELKFIPDSYFLGSIEQRKALLQGLLDTDGTITPSGRISFTSSSHQLCDDLACLVRSLGGSASEVRDQTKSKAYRIEIWVEMNPFRLQRKADRFVPKTKFMNLVSIRRIADEPSQCIAVDNEERQFIADCYFRTHNTGVRGAKEMGKRPQLAVLDDLISDEDARSATVIAAVEDTVYKAVNYALHPKKNMIIWSGTPFNAKDPLYKAVESGAWKVNVFPVCEHFPCTPEEFRGSWPDRFSYGYVKQQYDDALQLGKVETFNQELMLRIMSEEDRLIRDEDILWYSRRTVLENKHRFNFYITTDFATGAKQSNDFSVISVWAYNNNGDWFWVDGVCRRQTMDMNINDLFRLAQVYQPQAVGIEVSGQQGGFIPWLQNEMLNRNQWFTLASENNNNNPGIRPNTNKLVRFNVVVPWFKAKKMYFPEELKLSTPMAECIDELSLASASGFRSKHDDFIDTISMLASLTVWKPTQTGTVTASQSGGVWELEEQDDDEDYLGSYIV